MTSHVYINQYQHQLLSPVIESRTLEAMNNYSVSRVKVQATLNENAKRRQPMTRVVRCQSLL